MYSCAVPISRLLPFSEWLSATEPEGLAPLPFRDYCASDGPDEPVVFLREDYVVAATPFPDAAVLFDAVTADWKRFCRERLGFQVPPM